MPAAGGAGIRFADQGFQPGEPEGAVGADQTAHDRAPVLAQGHRWVGQRGGRADPFNGRQLLAIDHAMERIAVGLPGEGIEAEAHFAVMAHQQIGDEILLPKLQSCQTRGHLVAEAWPFMPAPLPRRLGPLALATTVGPHRGLKHRMSLADVVQPS